MIRIAAVMVVGARAKGDVCRDLRWPDRCCKVLITGARLAEFFYTYVGPFRLIRAGRFRDNGGPT
jgi:hypothetical protein